jgi:DNA-binding transcriptional LysR family regulator
MATRRMGLKHIEAFRAVMLAGSMTEASRRMHTSQPQISRLIGQLEAMVQFALFDRNGSRLTPTVDGARFFAEVEKTFVGLSGLEAAASNIRSFGGDRLSLAAMPRLAGGLLTRAVAAFKADHPDVLVTIHTGSAGAVSSWISSGFCDAGLAMLYADVSGMRVEPILTMDCVVVLPKGHRLTKLKRIRPIDLAKEAFISFPIGSPPRDQIDQVFNAAGVERRTVLESDLGASVCAFVAAGLGVSLINPLAALEEHRLSGIELRPFSPSVPVTLAMLFPPYEGGSRLVKLFAGYARKAMAPEAAALKAYRH